MGRLPLDFSKLTCYRLTLRQASGYVRQACFEIQPGKAFSLMKSTGSSLDDCGGKGPVPLWDGAVKIRIGKGADLAKGRQSFAIREHHIFLSVAAGTFLTGLLLSWLIFPPAYGAQNAFVDLKTTLPASSSQPVVPVQADRDLIAMLEGTSAPAGAYATQQPQSQWQTVRMRVTGYCACPICCGKFADGITACSHRIVAGEKFVAADKFYAFGTEMVIPGYNNDRPVPVLDRGRAIKGNRLDLYFDTHQEALRWGVQYVDVLVKI